MENPEVTGSNHVLAINSMCSFKKQQAIKKTNKQAKEKAINKQSNKSDIRTHRADAAAWL